MNRPRPSWHCCVFSSAKLFNALTNKSIQVLGWTGLTPVWEGAGLTRHNGLKVCNWISETPKHTFSSGCAALNTEETHGSSQHPESRELQQGTQKMFSNQRSQGQAVSTSKHGPVCAQGCCHRPSTPGEGTSGQASGEEPLGKQEPLWATPRHHGRCRSPGGAPLQSPPSSSPPAPPTGHGSHQRRMGPVPRLKQLEGD